MTGFGYAGTILKIDLSTGEKKYFPTAHFTDKFLGGRGLAARIYWETASSLVGALAPENPLICVTGPATGFNRIASSRWQVCAKSPAMQPEFFSYANLGGKWGIYLKFAGYDALVITGRSDKPVYIHINEKTVEVRDAAYLWGKTAFAAADEIKANLGSKVSVLTIGPAAENRVVFATLITDDGASGSNGMGSVMGSKNLKAIAVEGSKRPVAADPERFDRLVKDIKQKRENTWKNWLGEIEGKTKLQPCYGCGIGCFRKSYKEDGRRYKYLCQAAGFYRNYAQNHAMDDKWKEIILIATRLCDQYGLDTMVLSPMIEWLDMCHRNGVLTSAQTALPMDNIGSVEFINKLVSMIALRQGFGECLAKGTISAAAEIGPQAQEFLQYYVLNSANEMRDYDPRLILANSLLVSTEPRRPINQIHELSHALMMWLHWINQDEHAFLSYDDLRTVARNFWGGEEVADYTEYAGKSLAAKKIQDRTYAKESLILCDFMWPIIWRRFGEDHSGDSGMESRVLSSITGRDVDEEGLVHIGERVFNQQRAILLCQGWQGRNGDTLFDYQHDRPLETIFFNPECLVPGKDGKVVSLKGNKIDRKDFEKLKDEYYELRGWDLTSGLPTERRLSELGLDDVAEHLRSKGMLAVSPDEDRN
ncbi:MAG: hypothetical protein JXA79_09950 [Deltaproteobacteria bacterium]|nr:hypothetical protein [Deltaproteobacteria bacterium]